MKTYNTIVDFDLHCNRSKDVIPKSHYPTSIGCAKAILVKEDREVLPIYHPMPSGIRAIVLDSAHDKGLISDKQAKNIYAAYGAFDPLEVMYSLEKVVYGLSQGHYGGKNLYFSTLIVSGDLFSENPHAASSASNDWAYGREWDYEFRPGVFRLGSTGRILKDRQGEIFKEDLYLDITPEMVYDAVKDSGIHLEKVGIAGCDGEVDVVYDKKHSETGYVKSRFPKPESLNGKFFDNSYKKIDLTQIVESRGLSVELHPFCEQTKDLDGIYIFGTNSKFKSISDLANKASSITDNVVWKCAALNQYIGDPNSFLMNAKTFDCYVMYESHADHFSFGSTGRSIKTHEYLDKRGSCWKTISNWQPEYVGLKIDRNMLVSAILGLEEELQEVIMSTPGLDDPWMIVHDSRRGITPKNRLIIPNDKLNNTE